MEKKERNIWRFVNDLKGDKVVWIITLMLILLSIVCIFSSSSRLLKEGMTRLDIVKDQIITVLIGLFCLIFVYNCLKPSWLKNISQFGFGISLALLITMLVLPTDKDAPIHAGYINGAVRSIIVHGKQFYIYEAIKVAMVMYFAWAINRLKNEGGFKILRLLAGKLKWEWLTTNAAAKLLFLYLPFFVTVFLVSKGSNSSAIFMALIFLATIGIGQSSFKDILLMGGLAIAGGVIYVGIYLAKPSDEKSAEGKSANRIETLIGRLHHVDHVKEYKLHHLQKDLDAIRQPYSARIAIHDSRFIGKGPGQSTQRYVVPDMPEDYMFSFIIEEYGFAGGLLVIILYTSLFARGVIIIKECGDNLFAKIAIAGLILLICGQAFMHMFVNADFGLLTGQTLPLVSHGSSAFICFSIAFGIILRISSIAKPGIEEATKEAKKTFELGDTLQQSLMDLDTFEDEHLSTP